MVTILASKKPRELIRKLPMQLRELWIWSGRSSSIPLTMERVTQAQLASSDSARWLPLRVLRRLTVILMTLILQVERSKKKEPMLSQPRRISKRSLDKLRQKIS